MQSESRKSSESPAAPPRARLRLRLSALLWLSAAAAVAACFVVRNLDMLDTGLKNIASLATLGSATILIWAWFVFLSPLGRRVRYAVAGVSIALLAIGAGVFRFEEVSGDLTPTIAYRWTPEHDQLLQTPVATAPRAADEPVLSTTSANDYPQFLGPGRRATLDGPALATDWEADPPELLWRQPIGAGWSSFAVVGEHAVTQEQRGDQSLVVCYELRTGDVVWSHADPGRFESVLGGDGPRATPTVADGKVYTLGAAGLLNCLDGATGQVLWSHNVIDETGAEQVAWGRAASPLVVDRLVLVPAGGPGKSLVAYNKESGALVWAEGDDQVSYASPAYAELHGVRQVLVVNQNWLVSHRLSDGAELFRHEWPGDSDSNASTSQAVALEGNRVFVSKGYGIGSMLLQVDRDAEENFSTEVVWQDPSLLRTKLTNVVFRDGYVYGLSEGILECVDLDAGERMWKRGRFGHGQMILVDDLLLVTSERGDVSLVEANPEAYRELTKFDAIEGKTWNNPALSGNLLLVRNHEEAACYELPVDEADGDESGAD